jgi:hypothetical protein
VPEMVRDRDYASSCSLDGGLLLLAELMIIAQHPYYNEHASALRRPLTWLTRHRDLGLMEGT